MSSSAGLASSAVFAGALLSSTTAAIIIIIVLNQRSNELVYEVATYRPNNCKNQRKVYGLRVKMYIFWWKRTIYGSFLCLGLAVKKRKCVCNAAVVGS